MPKTHAKDSKGKYYCGAVFAQETEKEQEITCKICSRIKKQLEKVK